MRRLVQNGSLSATDLNELFAICTNEEAEFEPLSPEHLASEGLPGRPISLTRVSDVQGVNALVAEQELSLASSGLTVVYGDNGSGKSGYVRILKHACRSRDAKNLILPNVNEDTEQPQSAIVCFKRGDDNEQLEWSPDGSGHADLPAISIFDSRSANTHLAGESDVAYIPFPLLVLEQLASAADTLNQKIKEQIERLDAQKPQSLNGEINDGVTAAGAFIRQLSANSNEEQLELLTTISDDEQRRHANLKSDLAQDPQKAIAQLLSLKRRFETYVDNSRQLCNLASPERVTAVNGLKVRAEQTAILSKTASKELFEASPLPDIGGDLWKALWEAARDYSDREANPGRSFPEIQPDEDLCVLCQQPISLDASQRWNTFESFVKGTTKRDELAAKSEYQGALEHISASRLSVSEIRGWDTVVRDELGNSDLADQLRACVTIANWRLRAVGRGRIPSSVLPDIPDEGIQATLEEIDLRIRQLSASENSETRQEMRKEFAELSQRIRLETLKSDVLAQIERYKLTASLKRFAKSAAKRSITDKSKDLSDQLVTASLRNRFAREVEKLEIGTMPIELKKEKDRSGKSWFKIALVGMPDQPIGDVLSEGEHRCVALAAFLAELVTAKEYSGIVFDDPMSSLDHLYRGKVAKRLVEEAEHRQVIVFTHDLSFLFELKRVAEQVEREISFQSVERRQKKPGFIREDLPMKAKSAKSRSLAIRGELKELKGSFDSMKAVRREFLAKGIIAELRKTWEQAVADFVSPVLKQLDNQVHPSSMYKLLVLTEDDVEIIKAAYSRLSEDIHASPETLNPADVGHPDLVQEIEALEVWLDDIRARQKAA